MRTGWMVELASCIFCCKYNNLCTFLLENVATRGLSEVKRQTPGQLHSEVEAGGGR